MTTLTQIIKEYVAQAHENYKIVLDRIMRKAAEANQDLFPTVDKYGRLHAPCDGYEWDTETYAGGSYLPFPMEFWERLEEETGRPCGPSTKTSASYATKHRIKVTVAEAEEIKIACDRFAEVSVGMTWHDGVTCYIYIRTSRTKLSDLIADFRAEQEAALKAARDAEQAAKRALKGEAPEGRVVVKGVILAVKIVNRNAYHYHDSGVDIKILVELENKSTIWGNLPSALRDAKKGDTIEFTATFTPCKDDNTHGFFKRPAKAKLGV